MPRAHRFFLPGYIYHITHRCHNKDFLLRLKVDRKNWTEWLFEAKQRYQLSILNYTITSNHIHLLVKETGNNVIPKSLHLIAGSTAQAYNKRKNRKGAYWEDRYHATAVQDSSHFIRCMAYIDLNMVRAGVVNHPSDWEFGGYHEIRQPKSRYKIIDHNQLIHSGGQHTTMPIINRIDEEIKTQLQSQGNIDEKKISNSIALGDDQFIKKYKMELKSRGHSRKINNEGDINTLNEPKAAYGITTNSLPFQNP
ncbi:MAG: transposase [Planctomycetota bacterium]|nr:MAG: transposase [Planctomycetota bacterium]